MSRETVIQKIKAQRERAQRFLAADPHGPDAKAFLAVRSALDAILEDCEAADVAR